MGTETDRPRKFPLPNSPNRPKGRKPNPPPNAACHVVVAAATRLFALGLLFHAAWSPRVHTDIQAVQCESQLIRKFYTGITCTKRGRQVVPTGGTSSGRVGRPAAATSFRSPFAQRWSLPDPLTLRDGLTHSGVQYSPSRGTVPTYREGGTYIQRVPRPQPPTHRNDSLIGARFESSSV
jgi:hypothetical protein